MFFRMLKNNLKENKGLNIILFFFIIGASIVSVIAAALLYVQFVGLPQTSLLCNAPNIIINTAVGMGSFEEKGEALCEWAQNNPMIRDFEMTEFASLANGEVFINGRCANDPDFPNHKRFYLTTPTSRVGLRYDENGEAFCPASGCVAVSKDISEMAGIKIGDTIRITTQLGSFFEFEVSEIYRTPARNGEDLVISPVDYERLKSEEPLRFHRLLIRAGSVSCAERLYLELYDKKLVYTCNYVAYSPETDTNYTITFVISAFLAFMGGVILLVMMIMIRYMMLSAIKQEEKEIGMMRAIGVDSFRYRWMFASVYVCFAFIGGITGIAGGGPLSVFIIRRLNRNLVLADPHVFSKIAVFVSLSIMLLILVFSAIMMRRIKRVSIMEAIHGSNVGERFEKLNRIDLYRSKRTKVPLFLAFSDIVNSFGKYAFLIVAYMLTSTLLLTVFNLKSSVLSSEYQKHFLNLERDVEVYMYGELFDYYYQIGGDMDGAFREMCKDANEAGIPLSIRIFNGTNAMIEWEGKEAVAAKLWYGDTENEDILLRKGGKLPVRENEIILSYHTAKKEGVRIGDRLKVTVSECLNDELQYVSEEVEHEFIVTGFFDIMEEKGPEMIAGKEYTAGYGLSSRVTNVHLEAPKSEHARYLEKLKERFGEEYFDDAEECVRRNFSYVTGPIDAMKVVLSLISAFMLILMTSLYTNVDLSEETPGISILKTVGLTERDVKKWQMCRMWMIIVIAILLGFAMEYTLVEKLLNAICDSFSNTGVHIVSNPLECFVIVPLIILGIGTVAMALCLARVKRINIWNIRED
ncbi:MAG: ABC transporter permease [Lachnospiraceae bacterium]|nr:ABC transporter permease [Lachnospiraceae bacterium]